MTDRETPPTPPEPLAYYAPNPDARAKRYPPEPIGRLPRIAMYGANAAILLQIALCGGAMWSSAPMVDNPAIFIQAGVCAVAVMTGLCALFTTEYGSRGRQAAGWGVSVGLVLGALAGTLIYVRVAGIGEYMR